MNVQQVNLLTQQHNYNRPAFKGSVDKSVINLVNHATTNSISTIVKEANKSNNKVNTNELVKLKEIGSGIITKLKNFMKNFHKDTTLVAGDRGLFITNNKLGTHLSFNSSPQTNNSGKIYSVIIDIKDPTTTMKMKGVHREIDTERLSQKDLENLENFTNQTIALVDSNAVDKRLYETFIEDISNDAENTSFLGKIKLLINARKADKVAPEFGGNTGWKAKLTTIRDKAIAKKQQTENQKRQAKQLEIENNKIMKKILEK